MSAFIVGGLLLTNCHDDLDKVNPNQLTTETYFKTDADLKGAVNSIYSAMRGTNLITREWFWTHNMRSPDWASGGPALEAPRAQILVGGTTPDNPVMTAVFNGLYSMVHRANTVIVNAPEATGNRADIDLYVAEAKFLRGWAYFELVNFWGEVPIYTEPVTSVTGYLPKASIEEIYSLIIEDLKAAQAGLPDKQTGDNLGRGSGDAATAFLGKAYMQQLDYASAKAELEKLYGKYSLTPVYNDNFREENEFNQESIWEESNVYTGNSYNWNGDGSGATAALATTRSQEINPLSWRNAIPSDRLLNEYETPANTSYMEKVDPRMNYTIYFPAVAPATLGIPVIADTYKGSDGEDIPLTEAAQGNANSSTIYGKDVKVSWEKYAAIYKPQDNPANVFSGINTRIVRYAEVLLMLAECEAMAPGGDLTKAVGYLNEIRNRADVMMPNYPTPLYPVSNQQQVMDAVMHESMVERGGEEGRDFDVRRWIRAGVLPITPSPFETYTFQADKHMYLPIPQTEVSRNPNL